jgi:SAM-dependent methyltransferase
MPTTCLVCSSSEISPAFQQGGKRFWACASCRFVFVHDIYPEFEVFDGGKYLESVQGRKAPKPREVRDFEHTLASLAHSKATNRLLEVGCGQGFFLEHARTAGWETSGVEIVPEMVALMQSELGLDIFEGELSAAGYPAGSFDVVYMNEVIEHIPDPIGLMCEVSRILAPGGQALLRTGNAWSWSASWRGGAWPYYKFEGHGHIRFFSPASAEALACASGFSRVEVDTRGFAFRESAELRGHWAKPLVKLIQAPISTLAGPFRAGHRLTMRFYH